jgi:GAF domain-containing protein
VFQFEAKGSEKGAGLAAAVRSVLEGETDVVSALANVSAVIAMYIEGVNWAGFYFLRGKELVLGPFQGLPACSRIGEGKGVCGRAVREAKPVIVGNVHEFPGHIACDSASRSEMVVPLFRGGGVFGVLDVDSPRFDRFSGPEADGLAEAGAVISGWLDSLRL